MSSSDSDEYQIRFDMYEFILDEAKKAIEADIGKDVSSHINDLFREHRKELQRQGISQSKIEDLQQRMNAELDGEDASTKTSKKQKKQKKFKKRKRSKKRKRRSKKRRRSRKSKSRVKSFKK